MPPITIGDGEFFETALEIVERRMPSERRMYFYDGSGFPLDDSPSGIHPPGFTVTA